MTTPPAAYPPIDGTQPCAADPHAFFPHPHQVALHAGTAGPDGADGWRNAGPATREAWFEIEWALELCARCPFRRPCLAYALTHDVDGIWGGTTTHQRRDLRELHGITAVPIAVSDRELRAIDIDAMDRGGGLPLPRSPAPSD